MDKIFPRIKRTGDQLPDVQRAELTDEMGEVLLSGKPRKELLDKGQVVFEEMDDHQKNNGVNNYYLASFVTAHARLKLHEDLLHPLSLKDKLLYADTDSAIFIDDKSIKTGDYLGQLTNELKHGYWIEEYASSGPKSYAYRAVNVEGDFYQVCKIKGFTVRNNKDKLNLRALVSMVNDENHVIEISTSNITRNKKTKTLKNTTSTKKLSFVFDKRVLWPDYRSTPFGTKER